MEEKKNLEVVTGDNSKFSELDISAVHDNIHPAKPKSASKKPTNIVIPKENKKHAKKDEEDKEDTQNGYGKR